MQQPLQDKKETSLRTRCGYIPCESIRAFEKNLSDSGGVALGKALHFGADLVCSGGINSLFKILWEHSLNHVGIASVRIFMYLKKRLDEIDNLIKIYPDETLYANQEFQLKIGEIILIVHDAPKAPKIVWPKVGSETHDSIWIKNIATTVDSEIVNRVWKREGDLMILRTVGNEICRCLAEHSLERALFWIKWLFEEEIKMKKENTKSTLTTIDRGIGKSKQDVSLYILVIFAEYYKELARKQQIRMHEEFQSLLEIYKSNDPRYTSSFKRNLLGLIAQILCVVPRWKIAAANPLIKDPVILSRAVQQTPKFFTEILIYPSVVSRELDKVLKNKGKVSDHTTKDKVKKIITMEEQFAAFDTAMESYINGVNR